MPDPPRIAVQLDLKWPFERHAAVFAGTQRYAIEHGWRSIIDEFVAERLPTTRRTKPLPYDGVIARADRKLAERAARLKLPVVNVWYASPAWKRLPGVYPAFVESGRLVAEHLLGRGLRYFAAMQRRERGAQVEVGAFREAVGEAGFECIVEQLPMDFTRSYAIQRKSEQQITAWMDRWDVPIGVYVYGDSEARFVAQMCLQRGWRIPGDVALVAAFDNEQLCRHPHPSLTSVDRGFERIGYEAARLLDEQMARGAAAGQGGGKAVASSPPQLLIPPSGLVVRESTDFFAVEDELVAEALVFIAANSHREIGQDDVARAVFAETRTLQSRFRKVLNRPIAATIRQVRIERAKRELARSDRPLAAIARAVGFSEAARMYEVFRREVGITPSEYRKQRQPGKYGGARSEE